MVNTMVEEVKVSVDIDPDHGRHETGTKEAKENAVDHETETEATEIETETEVGGMAMQEI